MTTTTHTFEIDTDNLTVYHIDEYGEKWDLNADGEQITSKDELIEFVNELFNQKAFGNEARKELIDQI